MGNNLYFARKEKARKEALEWKEHLSEHDYSESEITEYQEHFRKLGRRYGLMQEFYENGIIKSWLDQLLEEKPSPTSLFHEVTDEFPENKDEDDNK